jgi:uncharacterized protein (TIGR02284 family)
MTTTSASHADLSKAHADLLNDLLELNRDSIEGFAKAKELADSPALKKICASAETERRAQVRELEPLVRAEGEKVEKDGTARGTLHRTWLTVREALSPNGDEALINEAERGEDEIKEAYMEALKEPLPTEWRGVIEKQAKQVFAIHDTFSDLKHGRITL